MIKSQRNQSQDAISKSRETLRHFFRLYKGKSQILKKEYVRIKVIRGHKRAIRQIFNGKLPRRTLHSFDTSDKVAVLAWEKLKETCLKYRERLNSISLTESGPLTDGKSKRASFSQEKSFNNDFCKWYFGFPEIIESYYYYIEHLFYDYQPQRLCKKLDLFCCDQEEHTSSCIAKWEQLKFYYSKLMLQELDLEAHEEIQIIVPRFFSKAVQTDLTSF